MRFDDWQEAVNHASTYETVAIQLMATGSCVIGWTDGCATHHDVLFTLSPLQFGNLQCGLRGRGNLFVSVMRRGCFAFDVSNVRDIHPNYIAEKLMESPESSTIQALATLVSGVIGALAAERVAKSALLPSSSIG